MGENDMMAYVAMMAIRLLELRRVLKSTGSLYLHCDPTASHYLKLILDSVFGPLQFRNEIIWKRTSAHSGAGRWGDVHDVILFYAKTQNYTWNTIFQVHDAAHIASKYGTKDKDGAYMPADLTGAGTRAGDSGKPWRGFDPNSFGRHWAVPTKVPAGRLDPTDWKSLTTQEKLDKLDNAELIYWPAKKDGFPRFKRYLSEGIPIQSVIEDIPPLNSQAQERLGYPTQKPLALLERIIQASSNPGDVVLDPFCGCGTATHASHKLGRSWIGIDITHLAISLIERRLKDAFPGIAFDVHGAPSDLDGARDLARRDKYQFQWWAISLIDAQPYGGKKKGADGGIDGLIYFRSDAKTTERAIVSVKGGGVSVPMIRDLKGVLDREKAPIGVFLTLEPPTKPMEKEAISAGFHTVLVGQGKERQYPRLQIITIEQALAGMKPAIPLVDAGAAFKRAAREKSDTQPTLL